MAKAPPFIVYALPRSRSFWLSRFLSCGAWHCGHDEMRHVRSMEDITDWFSQPCTGTVETAAAPWWRLIQRLRPDIRTVVIRRPVAEVVESCMNLGIPFDQEKLAANLTKMDRKLDQIEHRVSDVMSVPYSALADEGVCSKLFRHCLPMDMPHDYWEAFDRTNLQTSMLAALRYMAAHSKPLERFARVATARIVADMQRDRPEIDGVTFQQESFEDFLRDGPPTFAEHAAVVGEAPDAYLSRNIPMMRAVYARGALQITTARSNGRMFGYLMTLIGPSLENTTDIEALNLAFYGSPAIPGLGMKLQRASVDALRKRNVTAVFLRAGVRGSGPRIDALYRRLGAEPYGEMFRLDLKAA